MKKIIALFAALALTLSLASAHADSVHIERRLTDKVSINADFVTGAPDSAPILRMRLPNLRESERITLDTFADLTFWDKSSQIVTNGYDEEFSYNFCKENAAGEYVSLSELGGANFCYPLYCHRYRVGEEYVINDMGFRLDSVIQALPLQEKEDFIYSHDNFPIEQAEAMAMEAISYVLGEDSPLEPYPLYQYAVSYQQFEQIMDAYRSANPNTVELYSDYLDPDGWTEEDNVYFMEYGFKLNGLPLLSDATGIHHYSDDDIPTIPLTVTVNIQKNGFFFFDATIAEPEETPESELQPLLTPEQACDALAAYYDSIIQVNGNEITHAWLEYFPIPTRTELSLVEFTPVWAFSLDLTVGDIRHSNNRILRFNAITGEFII